MHLLLSHWDCVRDLGMGDLAIRLRMPGIGLLHLGWRGSPLLLRRVHLTRWHLLHRVLPRPLHWVISRCLCRIRLHLDLCSPLLLRLLHLLHVLHLVLTGLIVHVNFERIIFGSEGKFSRRAEENSGSATTTTAKCDEHPDNDANDVRRLVI